MIYRAPNIPRNSPEPIVHLSMTTSRLLQLLDDEEGETMLFCQTGVIGTANRPIARFDSKSQSAEELMLGLHDTNYLTR